MAVLANFGIPGAGSGILHPKHKHKWRVTFSGLGRLAPNVDARYITRQATNVTRPQLEFEEVTIHRYNSTAYVAGKHMWQPMTLTVEDDITSLASKAVKGQLETQQRIIGADLDGRWLNSSATGSDYKFGLKLEQLDGDEGVVEAWMIEGVYISNADWGDLDYSSSEAATIQLTLRFDHARSIDIGGAYGTALGGSLNA